jgi:predicted GNAT family N-acyltransferase
VFVKKCKNARELNDAQSVRKQVFVEEQGIDSQIESSEDEKCDHFVAYLDGKPVGAGRVNYPEIGTAKIERMAVLNSARGKGIGAEILKCMIEYLEDRPDIQKIILDAQYHAKGFYEKFGFEQDGDVFKEVGLPHIKMLKVIK